MNKMMEGNMAKKRALMFASVASMVDLFNRDNIKILEGLGCEVTVACNFSEGSVYSKRQAKHFMNELELAGYDVINVPVPRSVYDIGGMVKTVIRLSSELRKRHYDIVHCQSPIGGVLCRIAAMRARKHGTKVLYYAHGFHFYKGVPVKNWMIYYTVEKMCSHITDRILTLNREDYKRASRHFHARVEFVPGVGLDIGEIDAVPDEKKKVCKELGIAPNKKIVLSVCELSERKNCLVAVKAFLRLNRSDAVLVLCGIGSQEEMLKQYVKEAGANDRVIFAGFRNDIIKMFKAADIFVFTSKQEGLPVALMQAMACSLPVVCSRIRGNTDLVKDGVCGYMYDPMDVEGFSEGLEELLDNKAICHKMGKINRRRVRRYDIASVNEIMRNIYISLLD